VLLPVSEFNRRATTGHRLDERAQGGELPLATHDGVARLIRHPNPSRPDDRRSGDAVRLA